MFGTISFNWEQLMIVKLLIPPQIIAYLLIANSSGLLAETSMWID